MNRRINLHRCFVRIVRCNLLVHVEEVAILRFHHLLTQCDNLFSRWFRQPANACFCFAVTIDRTGEIQEDGFPRLIHTKARVAALLGGTRSDVPWDQISECRIPTFQIVIPISLCNVQCSYRSIPNRFRIFLLRRNPNATIVAQRLRHQCQFRLMLTRNRNACWMNLCEARVGHMSAFFMRLPSCRHIRSHCIRAQEEHIAITAGSQYNRVRCVTFQFSRNQIPSDDSTTFAIDHNHIHHFVAGQHVDLAFGNLTA